MKLQRILVMALGPIAAAILGLISLPILAWYFNSSVIGQLSMLQTVLSLAVVLFSLGLDQAYIREYHEQPNSAQLLAVTLLPGLVLLAITLVLLLCIAPQALSNWLFAIPSTIYSLGMAVLLLSALLLRFISVLHRMWEHSWIFALSQILPKALLLLLVLLAVVFDWPRDFNTLFNLQFFTNILVFLLFLILTIRAFIDMSCSRIDLNQLRAALQYSLPLMMGGLAFWALSSIDKVLLRHWSSFHELGLYSVAASFAAATALLSNVFNTLWAPSVFKWASQAQHVEKIQAIVRIVLALVALLICAMALAVPLVPLFLPREYANMGVLVLLCSVPALLYLLSEITGVGIALSRKTSLALWAAFAAFAMAMLLNYLLIPRYGAYGAALAKCVAFAFYFILRTELSRRVALALPRKELYSIMLLLLFSSMLSMALVQLSLLYYMAFWLLMSIIMLLYFRVPLRELLQQLRARFKPQAMP